METAGWMWLDGANRWHWIKEDHRSLCGRIACLSPLAGEVHNADEAQHCRACAQKLARIKQLAQ